MEGLHSISLFMLATANPGRRRRVHCVPRACKERMGLSRQARMGLSRQALGRLTARRGAAPAATQVPGGLPGEAPALTGCLWRTQHTRRRSRGASTPASCATAPRSPPPPPGVPQARLLPCNRKWLAGRPRGVDVHGGQRRVIAAHDVWAHAAAGDREVVLGHNPRSLVILRREDQVWTHAQDF